MLQPNEVPPQMMGMLRGADADGDGAITPKSSLASASGCAAAVAADSAVAAATAAGMVVAADAAAKTADAARTADGPTRTSNLELRIDAT